MDNTPEVEEWPTEWTREEMLEQQVSLVERENQLLHEELARYRQNLAKVIDMHSAAASERDSLACEIKKMSAEISRQNIAGNASWREIDSLKRVLHQRETIMRQHGVPAHYFGTSSGDVLEEDVVPKS